MDGTLTKLRSSWCWVHDTLNVNNEAAYQAYINGEIDEMEFMRRDIGLWLDVKKDITELEIAKMFRNMPLIGGIQETILALNYAGIKSIIVSGGIESAAKMIADEFGFAGYAADGLETYEDGRLTGEGILKVDLKDKGKTVREYIEKFGTTAERTVSIGNSFTDISMFKESGMSIAFNATDPWTEEAATHVVHGDSISSVLDYILDD